MRYHAILALRLHTQWARTPIVLASGGPPLNEGRNALAFARVRLASPLLSANKELLTGLLRQQWKFTGYVRPASYKHIQQTTDNRNMP